MMYVRSVSTRPARTLSARPARATGEARLARSPATQQTLFFALSFAAVGLRGTTGAAKADTAVFLVFTGAHVEATTRVAEAETAKDIFGGVGCAVQ